MATIHLESIIHHSRVGNYRFRIKSSSSTTNFLKSSSSSSSSSSLLNYCGSSKKFLHSNGLGKSLFCNFNHPRARSRNVVIKVTSSSSAGAATVETASESPVVVFKETYPLERIEKVEGKISVRLDNGKNEGHGKLTVGCTLPGNWILHWGVTYIEYVGSEWDQPPVEMRPPGSMPIKGYAIETPLEKSSSGEEQEVFQDVKIDIDYKNDIAAIHFVLKDQDTGAWYQHRGRDFKVPLIKNLIEDRRVMGEQKGNNIRPEASRQIPNIHNEEATLPKDKDTNKQNMFVEGFYEEHSIIKEVTFENSVSVSVRKCPKTAKSLIYLDTDLPDDVIVHWGVCREDTKKWELPSKPHPPQTELFKTNALRTLLEPKVGGNGNQGLFTLDEDLFGFLFVLKLNENSWLRCKGNDFFIPLSSSTSSTKDLGEKNASGQAILESTQLAEKNEEVDQALSKTAFTDEIINEIRNLVSDISSEKSRQTHTKEAKESILREIEKLAAEAYSIFRSSVPTFKEPDVLESQAPEAPPQICSGTGTGFEILCQGFNWESHKSGRWYMELKDRAVELSSLGVTVLWLPPPTDSVSPEGYMPRDLYNLNSRYGSFDELKVIVNTLHESGIKVLGDVVLNHRCAQHKNQNGIWNIFGGRLNWDDRAVVADDPHFQGRGNKSSGDSFHAAPNIDHSQDFVRNDLKEWLCWLRKEIGYDGWRLDFVRGFWGGYVKDYLDASEPYFAVGEYWDSLSYTYGEMDHNQDAHRQRIVDWINATGGTAGAFDVTTKGILHAALERCEYWRLSDQKGAPPGVVGWWPSRAVTFIENHDTGSTQGHWRFPGGKEMQGYAYILTHPGTPLVFYDHVFSQYKSEISALISLRNRNKIHCRSVVKIVKAERDVYAAIVDEKVAMKIGPGHFEPPSESQKWSFVLEGRDYKVWEASS